jgi:ribosomal protein S27E
MNLVDVTVVKPNGSFYVKCANCGELTHQRLIRCEHCGLTKNK